MKPILLFGARPVLEDLTKARVAGYTRKDGTFVKEHDNGRQAAAPKPAAKRAGGAKDKPADAYGHPNVVGHAEKLQGGDAEEAHAFHFAGKEFSHSGKSGTSMHDGTPVRHFREVTRGGEDSGDHVWLDHSGRVHADATSDVPRLRKQYEAHAGKAKAAAPKRKAKPAAKQVASNNTDWGFHGEAVREHISQKHGPDAYEGDLSQDDRKAAHEAAAKRFSDTANHLVQAGHFETHDQARDYLDSKHGRHLHDGATFHGGDASKVKWLEKDVRQYKASTYQPK